MAAPYKQRVVVPFEEGRSTVRVDYQCPKCGHEGARDVGVTSKMADLELDVTYDPAEITEVIRDPITKQVTGARKHHGSLSVTPVE